MLYEVITDAQGKAFLETIFGEGYNYPGVPPTDIITNYTSTGENAIITVNGTSVTSNTNSFTINGTTLDVSGLSTGIVDASVTIAKDNAKGIDAVKKFVEDYNALIDNLNSEIRTSYDT